ncbi:N-acetylmuramoyl-L-alanine amidase [Pelagibaculum spongiae]|uniref:N-acetylmuramoyl-L-alanine amidase AmiC n=1 Tax=Pelagibaculum spongiae TaxID=2080658 RepID=A0A2V1GYJ5_9GAMM|nr:N-acetylmuramoyl-L-alanine amidase [Pelagibaculum spongiae]PVZ70407.1 N-acetylmuramoyl-L-alanine amidase [Pelagibaculum spongiae]
MKRRDILLGLALLPQLIQQATAKSVASSNFAKLKGLRIWSAPDSTRLVLDLSRPVKHQVFPLTNPDRLVIDLQDCQWSASLPNPAKSYINQIRFGVRQKRDLRLVLDLNQTVQPRSIALRPSGEYGHRLLIELKNAEKKQKPLTAQQYEQPGKLRDVVVAIDAGHGGEDPGAIGGKGSREKHVTLAIAKALATEINRRRGMKAVLIRKSDYYIPLRKRVTLARKARADLFISIHADAFKDKRARGASVFALSRRGASSEQARWLAKQENSSDLIGGVSLDDKDQVLASVLLDLSQNESIRQSMDLASGVLGKLGRVGRLHSKKVGQAGFAVLKSPDIPSILVETGFITNPTEEKNLNSRNHRAKIAKAIASGFDQYLQRNPIAGTRLAAPTATRSQYVVSGGDTLSGIAVKYRVSIASLKRHNKLRSDRLRVGQVLRIP